MLAAFASHKLSARLENYNKLLNIKFEVFNTGIIPKDCQESIILNIYKGKGKALNSGNYMGFKQVMKVQESVLYSDIREMVDIDKIQFGIVPGRGTTTYYAIFIFCQL